MKQIAVEQLEAGRFYWARRKPAKGALVSDPGDFEIIRISTVFGSAPEFWTVILMGTDEHFDIQAYDFFHKVPSPPIEADNRAPLTMVQPVGRAVSH